MENRIKSEDQAEYSAAPSSPPQHSLATMKTAPSPGR